jgi:hypothetical protein
MTLSTQTKHMLRYNVNKAEMADCGLHDLEAGELFSR